MSDSKAAHELNELLTIIEGYTELAAELVGDSRPLAEYLQEIQRAAARAELIAQSLSAGAPAHPAATPVPSPSPAAPAASQSRRILLVDDENSVRRFTTAILKLNGYEVVSVSGGVEALACCEQVNGDFGLLISDVVMSPMTGLDLVHQVQARWPAIPVLLISGFPGHVEIPMGESGPTIPFLTKPFTNFALLAKVRELLQQT